MWNVSRNLEQLPAKCTDKYVPGSGCCHFVIFRPQFHNGREIKRDHQNKRQACPGLKNSTLLPSRSTMFQTEVFRLSFFVGRVQFGTVYSESLPPKYRCTVTVP